MCLEVKMFMKMRQFFGVLSIYYGIFASMVVVGQMQSPCPGIFEYEEDLNGGKVGVISDQENVELEVQLSLGNQVNGYRGSIDVTTPDDQLGDTIRNRQPIQYKVHFPRWTKQPPLITRIRVNDQTVCSGPRVQFGSSDVITTVTLGHRLTIPQQQHLSYQRPTGFQNNVITDPFPQLTIRRELIGTKTSENPYHRVNTNGNKFQPQDPNPKPDWGNGFGGSNENTWDFETLTPTTSVIRKTPDFSKNPFLNRRDSPPTATRPRPTLGDPTPHIERSTRPFQGQQPTPTPTRSYSPPSSSEECGVPLVANPLIFNGESVEPGAFPWLAAMFVRTGTGVEYRCCGSLVSHKHVITAAHCLKKGEDAYDPGDLHFFLGKHNLDDIFSFDKNEKRVQARDYKIHPEYVPRTADADIAVVILAQDVPYTRYIRPICLWSETDDLEYIVGKNGTIVGWGKTGPGNNAVRIKEPKRATGEIVSEEDCLRSGRIFKDITSHRSFCAGHRDNSGPCNGDSGSGFIMNRNGKWSLRGIVSISVLNTEQQSCDLYQYVAYTDVSKFRSWILSIINSI